MISNDDIAFVGAADGLYVELASGRVKWIFDAKGEAPPGASLPSKRDQKTVYVGGIDNCARCR